MFFGSYTLYLHTFKPTGKFEVYLKSVVSLCNFADAQTASCGPKQRGGWEARPSRCGCLSMCLTRSIEDHHCSGRTETLFSGANAERRSSCSKADAIRLISAGKSLSCSAVYRHFATDWATS
jgi:hypothetical protein